ncbi:RNA-binding KH domain-containing protein PEPPER [Frankliniella fusca]|uniref:RNA-binding KH domain-containing protein PEPPER n=1 Tax=Frankliniella fusca TaxID=407009 RepID=A0AAE1LBA9_9NEOP|nr:RNA-binding KH domain-containing protein PEPPER [Frankliniella fusca]
MSPSKCPTTSAHQASSNKGTDTTPFSVVLSSAQSETTTSLAGRSHHTSNIRIFHLIRGIPNNDVDDSLV